MRCLLNGKHCDALGSVGWVYTTGVNPHVQAFEMDAHEAKGLLDGGTEAILTIEDKKIVTVNQLSIVGEGPASAPMYRTVLVADLRWKWSRKLITGRYNVRRRTGQKHLVATSGIIQLGQSIDNFEFAPASLKGETTKWTPKELMEDILKKLGNGNDFEFDFDVEGNTDQLEVNDLDIHDMGPDALSIALGYFPGTTVWVDSIGKVHIQSTIGLQEASVIDGMGPDVVGQGHATKISNKLIRPSRIDVFFVREQEVRHDSADSGATTTGDDGRSMINVALVTDPVLNIQGNEVMYGSWQTVDRLFIPWNNDLPSAEDGFTIPPPISHTIVQQAFFEDALFRMYVPFGGDNPQPIWTGRINAIKSHYRQTWQLNRRWVDRSYQIQAVRCAIIDWATGTRGRTQAYGDYCVKVAAMPQTLKAYKGKLWTNIYGGAGNSAFSSGTTLDQAEVTPALVSMLDDQAGIVHFDYVVDPYGAWKQIYPSAVDNLPSSVMNDSKPKGANMKIGAGGTAPQLSPNHHCAVVLTHVPGFPNGNGQFYKISRVPGDVKGLVKGLEIDPAEGPPWEVLIEPGIVTARMAWLDAQSAVIERSFGVGQDPANMVAGPQAGDNDILRTLLVNEDDLIAIANAKAAEIWSKLTDRHIGAKSVRMDPGVTIRGSIDSVSHMVDTDGAVLTHVSLPEELQSRNYLALLPAGTRRIVFREVVPK